MIIVRRRYGVSFFFRFLLILSFLLMVRQLYKSTSISSSVGVKKNFNNPKLSPLSYYHNQLNADEEFESSQTNEYNEHEDKPFKNNVLDLFGLEKNKDVSDDKEDDYYYKESDSTTSTEEPVYLDKFPTADEKLNHQGSLLFTRAYPDEEEIESFGDSSTISEVTYVPELPDVEMLEQEFFEMLEDHRHGVTKTPVEFDKLKICIPSGSCLPFKEYKSLKAQQMMEEFANPFNKTYPVPTLRPYTDDIQRPNPLTMVKDVRMIVNEDDIKKELALEKKRRLTLGDDDLLKIPEIRTILMNQRNYKIPNIVHFIWFGCHRYKIHHYTSMMSAIRYQNPSLILFHTNCIPNGTYWNAFVNSAETLKIIRRTPPIQTFGQPIQKVEHQSDVARLQILLEVGGIYMDDDIIILKSLDELRDHDIVLGEENYDALANSIIMTSRNAWFLHRWFQEYRYFNDSRWSDSSCFVPWSMWKLFPSTVTVIKEKMLRPNWEEIKLLYHELWDWRDNYCIHLFSRFMRMVDGTEERTMQELAILNTTYGEISRHAIWGDYRIKDVSEWLFQ